MVIDPDISYANDGRGLLACLLALPFPRRGCIHSSCLSCGSRSADVRLAKSAAAPPPASPQGEEEAVSYNLLEEKWIPILWKDGHSDRVGVIKALECACGIRCIALASPLDRFAVHRFMLTLLYWKAVLAGGVEQVRESLLKSEKMQSAVLDGIRKEAHCFDLFDEEMPFLQDTSVRDDKEDHKKSVGSFFAELATGTNIAHFHHGDDENLRLCLPCATLGILRLVPWSQSGGSGLTPSIHNAPPIMAIATGDNLAVTLGLNLVPLNAMAGEAKWSGHFKPTDSTKPIVYLEALTWNPRRVFLPPPEAGDCWYCGQKDVPTVGAKIVYKKNETTKREKKGGKSLPFMWNDPSAFYEERHYEPAVSVGETQAIDNADLQTLVSSTSVLVSKNQSHRGWCLIVPSTDRRKKTFDHRQLELDSLSLDSISALLPPTSVPIKPVGVDGWDAPKPGDSTGIRVFVRAATRLLTHADWAALSNAAFREMHDSPAAFDVFTGLYWGLGDEKIGRLPSRNAAWLALKLMAAVPARVRVLRPGAQFSPLQDLDALPKRQPKERGRTFLYPVSFPRGERLEAALRGALDSNLRKRKPEPVDWVGLCYGLDQLLD